MSDTPARIAQVNVTYQREEDRLLLKIRSSDNAEFRLWLTRRYTQLLLRAIERLLIDDSSPGQAMEQTRAAQAFEHERVTASADRDTPYEESADEFPLGSNGVLGYRITVRPGQPPTLQLQPRTGSGISLPAHMELLHNLYALLRQAAEGAHWKLQARIQPDDKPTTKHLVN